MYKLIVLLIISFLSCNGANVPETEQEQTGLLKNLRITSDGVKRSYHLYVPENSNNKPIVVLLHGNGGSHNQIIGLTPAKAPHKVWLDLAEQDGFLIVVPNGLKASNGRRGWNDCRTGITVIPNTDDVGFINDLLAKIHGQYSYDKRKVYVAGTSNGGHLAYRLAQESPDRITAFASIVSSMPTNSECSSSTVPVSALIMNGTKDKILPYDGGPIAPKGDDDRGSVLSTQESVDFWVRRNQTNNTPIEEKMPNTSFSDGSRATKYTYVNGKNNTEVVHYKVINAGHTEPSIAQRHANAYLLIVGRQNSDFEMAEEIWEFFKTKNK